MWIFQNKFNMIKEPNFLSTLIMHKSHIKTLSPAFYCVKSTWKIHEWKSTKHSTNNYKELLEWHASFHTHETRQVLLDHVASSPASRETVSRLGIELPTTMFSLGTSPLSPRSLGSSLTKNVSYIHMYKLLEVYTWMFEKSPQGSLNLNFIYICVHSHS